VATSSPSPTSKSPRLGPEDKVRKESMITALKARGMLSPSAERYIRSGLR